MQPIYIVLFLVLFISAIVAIIRFKYLNFEDRIIATLLIVTFPQVVLCFILFKHKINNIQIIQWYSLTEFGLIMLYYYRLLFKRWLRLLVAVLTGIGIIWFVAVVFIQEHFLHSFSFVLFEAFAIIVVGLFYCLQLLIRGELVVTRLPSFWITVILLFYWTITYTRNGLLIFYDRVTPLFLQNLEYFFITVNILFYVALASVLLNYKRFVSIYE